MEGGTKTPYAERIERLRATKQRQAAEKQRVIGATDYDDWGLVLPPPELHYYERGRAADRMTGEEAVFHIACMLLRDTGYIQFGGRDSVGRDDTMSCWAIGVAGTSLAGGKGSFLGTMVGALALTLLNRLLVLLQTDEAGRQIVNGGVLAALLAVYNREPRIRR